MQDEDPKFLCVGGPLHGARKFANGLTLVHKTVGGPPGTDWLVRHEYDRVFLPDGRQFWKWRMIPSWTRAEFMKPMFRGISDQN